MGRSLVTAGSLIVVGSLPAVLANVTSPAVMGVVVLGLAFVASWAWFWLRAVERGGVENLVAVLAVCLLAAGLTLTAPAGRDGILFAALVAGAGLRGRRGVMAVVGLALAAGVLQIYKGSPVPAAGATMVNDVLAGFAAIAGRLLLHTNQRLEAAQERIAELAISEERLRVARDLHDVIGQNLTVAVLKSELVATELPPDVNPGLRENVMDVVAAVRRSLDELREVVAGYRQPRIAAELASAGTVLRAAGVELAIEESLGPISPVTEAVLAWALREGVTNVVRHSHAARCTVRLWRERDRSVLEVSDDGQGGLTKGSGSGLRGIEERAAAIGGSVQISPDAGFRLVVSVPLE